MKGADRRGAFCTEFPALLTQWLEAKRQMHESLCETGTGSCPVGAKPVSLQ